MAPHLLHAKEERCMELTKRVPPGCADLTPINKRGSLLNFINHACSIIGLLFALSLFAQTEAPKVNAVVNAASSTPALSPGALVSVYGTNLAGSIAQAPVLPLPTQLLDVNVALNDRLLPLLYVSPGQINAQLP